MARITKKTRGNFVKGKQLTDGTSVSIATETKMELSAFLNPSGQKKEQAICKLNFVGTDGKEYSENFRLNTQTLEGLVDAFGEESLDWIGKPLTVKLDTVSIGGKRQTAAYLLAEGYELTTDDNDFVVIRRAK